MNQPQLNKRKTIVSWSIKILAALIFFLFIYRFLQGQVSEQLQLVDSLSITGIVYVVIGIFIAASNENIFASVTYFAKQVANLFRKIPKSLPPTYHEYLIERQQQGKVKASPFFIIGLTFIGLALVFIWVYKLI